VRLFKQIPLDGEDDCDLIVRNQNESESNETTENEDECSADEIKTILDVNKEILEIQNELRKLSIDEKSFCRSDDEIIIEASVTEDVEQEKFIEEEEHKIDKINNTLIINLGSSELPRISCANH
jgi:hypothetical protein